MRNVFFIVCLLSIPSLLVGQQEQEQEQVLSQERFLLFVANFHPVAQQGLLLLSGGESAIREARGKFDPKLYGTYDQKQYAEKQYYSLLGAGLKVPTWFGVELKAGYEQNSGEFLNPENTLPGEGLWFAGVSVPIGNGLMMDKRRAMLRQADLFAISTRAEQMNLMNDLFFDAIKHYWKWTEAWNKLQVYSNAATIAQERFEAVRQSFLFGDKPAIDTLEAFIQVQNLQVMRNEYNLVYQNSTLELSNFLWLEDGTPLEITEELHPYQYEEIQMQKLPMDSLKRILYELPENHPELRLYGLKNASMEIDRRLAAEGFKPTINLNYNFLSQSVGSESTFSTQNYKWGAEFSFPLFLRSQRGKVQLTKLKIQDNTLAQKQKLLQIQNKVKSYYNKQETLDAQIIILRNAVNNYQRMLEGERRKFEVGESSLFLVNSRQKNLIDGLNAFITALLKFHVSKAGIFHSAGELYLVEKYLPYEL